MSAKVSVLIPFNEQVDYLQQCIASVASQTFQDFEVTFINLGAEQASLDIVNSWLKTTGPYKEVCSVALDDFFDSLNNVIEKLDSDYITILSSQDVWDPIFLENMVNTLDALPDLNMGYSQFDVIDDKQESKVFPPLAPHHRSSIVDDANLLVAHPWIALSSAVFRRQAFEKIGGFKPEFKDYADYVFWLEVALESPSYYCEDKLVKLRDCQDRAANPYLFEHKLDKQLLSAQDTLLTYPSVHLAEHTFLLMKCRQVSLLTGLPLSNAALSMLEPEQADFLNIEKKTMHLFLLAVAEIILSLNNSLDRANLDPKAYGSVADALDLISTVLEEDPKHEQAKQLLEQNAELQLNLDYQHWVKNHSLQEIDAQIHAERMSLQWQMHPQFHFVLFLFDGEENLLANTIDSLSKQFYKNWHLSVIASQPAPDLMFEEFDVLSWHQCPLDIDPYTLLNQLFVHTESDYIGFIPAGTQVEPQCLLQFGDYINKFPEKSVFYCDDDLIMEDGERHSPRFKPDFNLEMLRSVDYIGASAVIKRDTFITLGGYDAIPANENRDLIFKVFEILGKDVVTHISDVLIHLPETVGLYDNAQLSSQTVQKHLDRSLIPATIEDGFLPNTLKINYLHDEKPKVTIIIPTRDKLELLRACVDSVINKTAYENYELVIVDNDSEDPDTIDYLQNITENYTANIRVISFPGKFNYAAISNLAAHAATGDYLLFLNNDTVVVHDEWLQRMLSYGQLDDVGVVGARLAYPETGMIHHAGIILGMNNTAELLFRDSCKVDQPGYMGRAQLAQEFSAVTAACMLIKKQTYFAAGGMDEDQFAVKYNDVDLCLKVKELEQRVVWTPFVTLIHHGNRSLHERFNKADVFEKALIHQQSEDEDDYFLNKWLPLIANDPAFNRHLSLNGPDVVIESAMPCNWDTEFHDRPRIIGLPLSGGCGAYRVVEPLEALSHAGHAQCETYRFKGHASRDISVAEVAQLAPDTMIFHAAVNDIQLKVLKNVVTYHPDIFRVYTIDDLLTNVPEKSSAYKYVKRQFSDAKARLRKAVNSCDRLIVSTQPLADLCEGLIDDVRVVPNRLRRDVWCNLTSKRNTTAKLRVGWAGAQQHQGDLEIITEVVKQTADEVDWVFMGMMPAAMKPYVKEFHEFVPLEEYPEKLASLNLDLAVAPLELHPFNESKSNLRLLEYGVLGWPVICTDIYPYQTDNAPVLRLSNEHQVWLDAIRAAISNPTALHQAGDNLRQWVLNDYILEDHLDEWLDVFTR